MYHSLSEEASDTALLKALRTPEGVISYFKSQISNMNEEKNYKVPTLGIWNIDFLIHLRFEICNMRFPVHGNVLVSFLKNQID